MKGRPARLVAPKRLKREDFTAGNGARGFSSFHIVMVTRPTVLSKEQSASSWGIPVVVPESDVSAGLQDLAVLQPGELRLGLALGLAGECGGGADGPGHRLRGLAELCRS